jgi:hypothetical protein
MTGDLVKAMIHCGKPVIAAVDGVAWAPVRSLPWRRICGLRRPRQDGVPVHPRGPCRLRHGRLRDAAAHHRAGPGGRTALHRPQHERRGRRRLGLLQRASRGRRRWSRGARAGARASPLGRLLHMASPRRSSARNGTWASIRRSRPKRRRRRSACRPATSSAPIGRSWRRKSRCSRELILGRRPGAPPPDPRDTWEKKKMSDRSFLDWPFFEARHRELAAALDGWCGANLPVDHGDVDAACRSLVALLGRAGGSATAARAWVTIRSDVRTLVPDPRDPGAP